MLHQFSYRAQSVQTGAPLIHFTIFRYYCGIPNHNRDNFFSQTGLVHSRAQNWCNMSHQFLYSAQSVQTGAPLIHVTIFRYYYWILNRNRDSFFSRPSLVDLPALETDVTCYISFCIEPRRAILCMISNVIIFTDVYWTYLHPEFISLHL